MKPKSLNIKIGKGEIEHILNLKSSFADHREILVDHVVRYLDLGWALLANDVQTGKDLDYGFQDVDTWITRLEDPRVNPARINLAVHTGSLSGLLVLEIANAEESSRLDEWGAWRSQCVAKLGTGLEKHFYLLSPEFRPFPINGHFYAEGATTLLPPSLDPFTQERWRWQKPPWDSPPPPLPLAFLNCLKALPGPTATGSDLSNKLRVSWRELYCLISPFEAVLQAFAHGEASMGDYYGKLFRAALEAGLTDSDLLLSLLWHAPLGDARQRPERWAYLQKLVSQVRLEEPSQAPKFVNGSRTIYLVKRPLMNSQENGRADRQPLSRRASKNS
ncbi:MAG: hypothetical protein NTY36_13805 [Deltaproteobacteria bacterium]|nr:hypothetical protein [Deltaproteobacteria bacterium]